MSRGTSFAIAGRTRKGLTLLWVALFVFSLAAAVRALAAPSAAIAASGLLAGDRRGIRDRWRPDCLNASGNPRRDPGRHAPAESDRRPATNGDDWLDRGAACAGVVRPGNIRRSRASTSIRSTPAPMTSTRAATRKTTPGTGRSSPDRSRRPRRLQPSMAHAKFVGDQRLLLRRRRPASSTTATTTSTSS